MNDILNNKIKKLKGELLCQKRNIDNLVIENARIIFRNFSGKGDKFNRDGVRTFCVIIEDPDVAARMSDDSWNVKTLKPKDDGDIPVSYIQVMVSYRIYQPGVTLITSKRKNKNRRRTL